MPSGPSNDLQRMISRLIYVYKVILPLEIEFIDHLIE